MLAPPELRANRPQKPISRFLYTPDGIKIMAINKDRERRHKEQAHCAQCGISAIHSVKRGKNTTTIHYQAANSQRRTLDHSHEQIPVVLFQPVVRIAGMV
jgi:ribosomal protein L34E